MAPTLQPTLRPTTASPTARPTTASPTRAPTASPTAAPTRGPTISPTAPTSAPTAANLDMHDHWNDVPPPPYATQPFSPFGWGLFDTMWDNLRFATYSFTSFYREEVINQLPANSGQTTAQYVFFNIPPGYVISLLSVVPAAQGTVPYTDFENQLRYGPTIELIGTGALQAKKLVNGFHVVAWAYYRFNPLVGYVQVFSAPSLGGNRWAIFPSRYSFNSLTPFYSLTADGTINFPWYWNDCIRSIDWNHLDPTIRMTFYVTTNPLSLAYYGVDGKAPNIVSDLSIFNGLNAAFSAFSWEIRPPLDIFALPVPISVNNIQSSQNSILKTIYVFVPENVSSEVEVSVERSWEKTSEATVSRSVTDISSLSIEAGVEIGSGELMPVEAKVHLDVKAEISQELTSELEKTISTTETITISESHKVIIERPGHFQVSLMMEIFEVRLARLTFNVVRSYSYQVPGAVFSGTFWTRTEQVDLIASGNFVGQSRLLVVPI